MKYKEKKVKGGIAISLKCEHCGKPINVTSRHFGMDCKNHCAEKHMSKAEKEFSGLMSPDNPLWNKNDEGESVLNALMKLAFIKNE